MNSIPTVIDAVCTIAGAFNGAIKAGVAVSKMINEANISKLKQASLTSRSAALALDIFEIHKGDKKKNIDLPARFSMNPEPFGKMKTAQGIIDLIQKKMFFSAEILQNTFETSCIIENKFLEDLKQNPNAKRATWKINEEGFYAIDTFKEIDQKECERNIALFKKLTPGFYRQHYIEESYQVIIIRTIERILRQRVLNDRIQELDVDQAFNFKEKNQIPEEFLGDKIFNKYICAITHHPIRNILMELDDVRNPIFYDRQAIEKWLEQYPYSPVTGKHLTLEQLFLNPLIQDRIDARLEFYERQIKIYLLALKKDMPNPKKVKPEIKEKPQIKPADKKAKEKSTFFKIISAPFVFIKNCFMSIYKRIFGKD